MNAFVDFSATASSNSNPFLCVNDKLDATTYATELPPLVVDDDENVYCDYEIDELPMDDEGNRILPSSFTPTSKHTICARGKTYWNHKGNVKYRQLIAAATTKYQFASTKLEKTNIVSDIVTALQHNGHGGLIKKDNSSIAPTSSSSLLTKKKNIKQNDDNSSRWVICNIHFAREKVSQSLRDSLSSQYKSSTKTKKTRRMKVTEKINLDIDKAITSNKGVMSRINKLHTDLQIKNNSYASDYTVMNMFSLANLDILETIKKDANLLNQYQLATNEANNTANATVVVVTTTHTQQQVEQAAC